MTFSFHKSLSIVAVAAAVFCFGRAGAYGQIYVIDQTTANTVAEFNLNGTLVNDTLISGLSSPRGLAASGSNLFVANYGNGTIGKYDFNGNAVSTSLISGLSSPGAMAVDGTHLFVANNGNHTIGEYNLDGTVVNASLVSGLPSSVQGITVYGGQLFFLQFATHGDTVHNLISVYNVVDGATANASLVSGFIQPGGIAASGGQLYIADESLGVKKYNIDGTLVNGSLISGSPFVGIAVSGGHLFVDIDGITGGQQTIGEYDLDGTTVNASLISGLTFPGALVVIAPVPEPSTYAAIVGIVALGVTMMRRRRS